MMRILMIAAGGAVGAVLRYFLSSWTNQWLGSGFPWGSLAVNLGGSLAIGLLWAASERTPFPPGWSLFVFTGLLGAFTTYSAFAFETVTLWREGQVLLAGINMAASAAGTVLCAFLGLIAGRALFGG